MRKWVTFSFVIALILVPLFFVSGPKKGTVEWHKAKYMKAYERIHGTTVPEEIENTAKGLIGIATPEASRAKRQLNAENEAESHLSALVALGYLVERRYVITNRSLNDVLRHTLDGRRALGQEYRPPNLTVRVPGEGQLLVRALPEIAAQYDELIRKADVSENAK